MKNASDIIGSKVTHGSPGYPVKEVILDVLLLNLKGEVEIQFQSGCFTRLTKEEFDTFLAKGELTYKEKTHGGFSTLVLSK